MFPSGSCLTIKLQPKSAALNENGTRRIYLSRKAAKLVYIPPINTKATDFYKHDKRYNPTRIISIVW